ncbi:Putrescine aminotransferase [Sporotomaculum syntrophicum]|uniref:Putrescine aminotransferase n=1 Tax=Sporotomaculum syntrophicum TaxID=182264 RepID=A0A9D3AYG2_9FIRM|nr:aminotransferase class III-fold pyridoxal phosphate-dependent enzyme [Sporotomaculum syntrophicum]KAF1084733.1 Putrescine aminotransferase [Sporotomaculum syntrophicum]
MHNFSRYVNPHLGDLLEQVHLDKTYIRGEGHYLFDSEGKRYLDFIAAYGALPFGYNPPEIWQAIDEVRTSAEPSFIQPSVLEAAGELARRLIELAPEGLQYVTFTNSGAETVEAAIKMARSATGRPGILSTTNSFHGKTLGALSATGREYYQLPFGAPVEGFKSIPYNDLAALEQELENNNGRYAALLLEPIQGEGGIVVPSSGYLVQARELCRQHGVLFVLDEIQTGLGRTGRLFACEEENLCPDMLLLAKALGGGIFPIGACLSTAEAYSKDFAERHSSTFAANTLGCRIGLKVLDILVRNDQSMIRRVQDNGRRLREALEMLLQRYPRVIKSIRGRGYMLGVEFDLSRADFPSSYLSVLSYQDNLTPLIASYLLNVEGLRVAPTLNGNKVIRLEPSLTVTWEECQVVLQALEKVSNVLDKGNTPELLRPIIGLGNQPIIHKPREEMYPWDRYQPTGHSEEGRFAFIIHPLDLYQYPLFDPSLKGIASDALQKLAELGSQQMKPFVMGRTAVVSRAGRRAYGEFICLPHTAKEMLELNTEVINQELEKALELAQQRGACIAGLGAYTSVVSRGGLLLQGKVLPLTTGNSYTVVAGVEAIKLAARRFKMDLSQCSAAIIGATGAIGRTLAILLSEEMQNIILVGNARHPQASTRRLRQAGAYCCMHLAEQASRGWQPAPDSFGANLLLMDLPPLGTPVDNWLPVVAELEQQGRLVITTDIAQALPRAQVVLTATSSVDELVNPRWLANGAIVCDISKPSNVSPTVRQIRPDVLVIDGGVVAVPGRPTLGWNFGFEQGLGYACMAETMMLALEHHYQDISLGSDLSLDNMMYFRELAVKHGFELAQLRSFEQPLSEQEWERVAKARRQKDHLINIAR